MGAAEHLRHFADEAVARAPQDLFRAQTTWFHMFKDLIDSGDLARLDGSAVKCYLIIKSHTNFVTGQSFPGIETIAAAAGLSESQVMRCIKNLEESGYIKKHRKGRRNIYTLREKVNLTDEQGRPQAVATWDYIPGGVRDAVADLKDVVMTGDLAGAKVVHIERMHVNVQVNNGSGSAIQFNLDDIQKLPKEMQEALLKIRPSQ